jgi:poly(3-hydroxybutyrate) depolymerase
MKSFAYARSLLTAGAALAALGSACGDDGETGGGGAGGAASSAGTTTGPASGSGAVTSGQATSSAASSTATATSSSTGGGGAQGCLQDVSAGHHQVSCDGGITYDVEIPGACTGGPCGLIVDMHGYTMNADSENENTGMRALGQQHGYVVVQPTAPADNLSFPSWDQGAHAPLVHTFLADLAASLPIDPAKIHAMGFSQGGGMTFRLLCMHAEFFASGAPIGALPGCEFSGGNTPSEEVDILQVHGRTDGIVSFDAQAVPQRDDVLGGFPFGPPTVLEDDGMHKATRWVTPTGTVFEFWEHDYQTSASVLFVDLNGHCVPGGTDFSGTPAGYSCEDMNTFVFGQLAMQFFQAHPKD